MYLICHTCISCKKIIKEQSNEKKPNETNFICVPCGITESNKEKSEYYRKHSED